MAKDNNDILAEIKANFKKAYDAAEAEYTMMIDDLRFMNGEQWAQSLKADREADGRPCLTINKTAVFHDQIAGDIRMNTPSIKVKPVDSGADPDTAKMIMGLIRNIEHQSGADAAYDTAGESAAACGKGTFRIVTEYASDDSFDQEIYIRRMKNPFTVFWDPAAQEWDKRDADYCFVTEKIDRDTFFEQYPDGSASSFDAGKDSDASWGDKETVRVVEYFKRDPVISKLYLIQYADKTEPEVVDTLPDKTLYQYEVLKERKVESHKLIWYKATAAEILEGPIEMAGKYIPIVEIWGKEINIENETHYRGVVRNMIDPQKLYNYSRSTSAEVISLAPKAPYLVTAAMVGEYQAIWNKAHKKSFPYLPYTPDPKMPGVMPSKTPPISADTGIINEIMVSDQELHDTSGLQQASLGKQSNEKSGKAIQARQREGDVANYVYYDNITRGLRYAGKVIVDLIPSIYDVPKVRRIMGEDGTEQMVQFGEPFVDKDGKSKLYDLTTGRYDVVVSIGPSYSTQREEAADNMMNFMGAIPGTAPLIADLVVGNMDWPGADEISDRLKKTLPPGLLPPEQDGGGQGQPPPGPPPPPDPMMMMEMEKAKVLLQQEQLKAVKLKAEIEKIQVETKLKAMEAAFPQERAKT
uniref:Putative P22-like portal protein n=1 Tax=viral metagenome TaxID=1070528 RepID=A0A6M3IEK9_9ZZZZ